MGNDAMGLMQAVSLDEFAAWVSKRSFFHINRLAA